MKFSNIRPTSGSSCLIRSVAMSLNAVFPYSHCTYVKPEDLIWFQRKEGTVLFNDGPNFVYLRLYGVRHMVKKHSDSERGNPLPPHGLLFPNSSKGYFICIIPHTG